MEKPDRDLTEFDLSQLSDAELNDLLRRYGRRGPMAWLVFMTEEETEKRRKTKRGAG